MNFTSTSQTDHLMTAVKPLSCGFHTPPALKGKGRHDLPPCAPRKSFLVDEYPACPDHWMRSEGRTASYFVPVKEETGMWLDFNDTLQHTKHHVAIVISVQGINAVTGLPASSPHLEQYLDNCPRHKTPFGPGRLCKDCNFVWPKQNYICSSGTPGGWLWLDGFRTVDGAVRQYVFTKDKMRGVAKAIIGEKRVFAVGISCFLSKEPRPAPVYNLSTAWGGKLGNSGGIDYNEVYGQLMSDSCSDTPIGCDFMSSGPDDGPVYGGSLKKSFVDDSLTHSSKKSLKTAADKISDINAATKLLRSATYSAKVDVQQVEVAAGEEINQHVYDDPFSLDAWQSEPEAILVINYALEVDVEKILAGGRIEMKGNPNGFLAGIPVGQS